MKKNIVQRVKQIFWNDVIWDKEMISYLMEFFSLTEEETKMMMKLGRKNVFMFWNALNPKTPEEIIKFYEIVPHQIFSLAYWHMKVNQRKFRQKVIQYCLEGRGDGGSKVLDFGGGIGDLSVKLAEKGLNVTYADVKGKNMEFAKWLSKKKGLQIKFIDATKPLPSQNYDTILCIDTIEHVPNPKQTLTTLCEHLKPHGRLIITNYKCRGDDNPLHKPIEFDAEKLMETKGLRKRMNEIRLKENWLWIKIRG